MTNSSNVKKIVFDSFGITGGIIYPICTITQIVRVAKTKSTKDLELSSIILFMFATILILIYSFYFELYAIYIPSIFDFLTQTTLLSLKVYFDKKNKPSLDDIKKESVNTT